MAWFSQVASVFSDMKICAMVRERQGEACQGIPLQCSPSLVPTRFPGPKNPLHCRFNSVDSTAPTKEVGLPSDFFVKLAAFAVEDPHIAIRIEDDRTCPLIWGHASSLRFQFLQMCIRDRYDRCKELWSQLDEFDRRDFMAVYRSGPPSAEYFFNIMVVEEKTWMELSDNGSDNGSVVSFGSDNSSMNGTGWTDI